MCTCEGGEKMSLINIETDSSSSSGGGAFLRLCLHTVHCPVLYLPVMPLGDITVWRMSWTELITRSSSLRSFPLPTMHLGPAGELVCELAVGSICEPSLAEKIYSKSSEHKIPLKQQVVITGNNWHLAHYLNLQEGTRQWGLEAKNLMIWWGKNRVNGTYQQHPLYSILLL